MNGLEFYVLDVFAKEKYNGNQLAVFIDFEDQLNEEQMLTIAKEINFAESSFVKRQLADNMFEVRIFTPECEVPFAGHPTLGTSYIISRFLLEQPRKELILRLKNGDIKVELSNTSDLNTCLFQMTQTTPQYLQTFNKTAFCQVLNLEESDLAEDAIIEEITTGLPYIIVPVKDLTVMNQLSLDAKRLIDFLKQNKIYKTDRTSGLSTALFFFTTQTHEPASDYNTRMFSVENELLVEDAATGSANGCFLAYLLKNYHNKVEAQVEQGFQMARKSYLYLQGKWTEEAIEIKVGGYSKLVAQGTWLV